MHPRTILTITMFMLLVAGMTIGIIYKTQKPKICLFNETRFLTLTSLGVLSDAKDQKQFGETLSKTEIATIKDLMSKLKQTISSQCGKHTPILIEKKDKSLEIYSEVEIRDITNSVTKKILGDKKWQQVWQTFLR